MWYVEFIDTKPARQNPMEPEARFKIDELAEATDLSRRTIHHYIAEGMIPRARGGAGPAAYYDEEHYLRLRILTRLKGMGLSLSTIRDSLNDLSLEEMREVLELPEDFNYRAIWAHVAMKRSGTPESFRVEEAELHEGRGDMLWQRLDLEPRRRARPTRRATRAMPAMDTPDIDLRQEAFGASSSPGAIRRDPEFIERLADERRRHDAQDFKQRTEDSPPDSLHQFDVDEDVASLMAPPAYRDLDPRDEALHPEMDSQPWRRVRVSNDLEISYRPSSDPLTKKKLRHLLEFAHRLFRLERSTDERTLDTETDPTRGPRTPGERPQDPEEET